MASTAQSAAEHMDGIYRYQRYIYDATRKYYLLGRDRLIDELEAPPGSAVLEVACGTGRNLIAAARRYPQARLYGFDISSAMLETAEVAIAKARLAGRIAVAQGDATSFASRELFGPKQFDRIFISYALSMIPPWEEALEEALSALAPQGRLMIVDFGRQAQLPGVFKRGLRHWLAQFSVDPRDHLGYVLDGIAAMPGYKVRHEQLYGGYAVYAVITRASPVSGPSAT